MTESNQDNNSVATSFDELNLPQALLQAVAKSGYESPSPIQAKMIPIMLSGADVIGQAQTGTGKTAAFALPILSMIETSRAVPQVLVLTPTRELAIQVAEAFQNYARTMKGVHVLPIYGGQDFRTQLKALQRKPQIIIGTPGRVMDHMRRKTLDISQLKHLVLDEADEMLRMGFIDDVEWVLEHTPDTRQIALFSATMPKQINKIARTYLNNPQEVAIKDKEKTANTIEQFYWIVKGIHKLDALTRMLEIADYDGIIVFVRTKTGTTELADKLQARGYVAAAINGDMAQASREIVVNKLKKGKIDILVATDVAARGLDVDRISHVINYDIPYDAEAYVHRIGRTGRAGRTGEAILFVAPREKRLLQSIERATKTSIKPMQLPSAQMLNEKRAERFKEKIVKSLETDLTPYVNLIEQMLHELDVPAEKLAAALAKTAQGKDPLFVKDVKEVKHEAFDMDSSMPRSDNRSRKKSRNDPEVKMAHYRLAVGKKEGVKPGNIVGAIANEAGLDSKYIGRIDIQESFTTLTLPADMPSEIFAHLKNVRVEGKKLDIELMDKPKRRSPRTKPKRR